MDSIRDITKKFRNIVRLLWASVYCILLFTTCTIPSEKDQTSSLVVLPLSAPVLTEGSLPYLVTGSDDKLYMSWVSHEGDTAELNYSWWHGDAWSKSQVIARGTNWFVNWADYPMISVQIDNSMLGHFLAKNDSSTYAYDIHIIGKPADSLWGSAFVPHKDGTATEHGFVSMVPLDQGNFQIVWLDGRNTQTDGHDHGGGMTLRTAQTDVEGQLSFEQELDALVCDCCQTTGVLTNQGPVIFYRDRSPDELRDIAVVRQVQGQWTSPQIVFADEWKIAGCPVNGPRATALGDQIAVAWFTAANERPQVKVAFSEDAGAHFQEPLVIDSDQPLGRVDIVLVDSKKAIVSWLTKEASQTVIKIQVVFSTGELGAQLTIAESSELRASGFPQLAMLGDILYMAWTQIGSDEKKYLKFAKIIM